jgi:hypothetical protein
MRDSARGLGDHFDGFRKIRGFDDGKAGERKKAVRAFAKELESATIENA